MNISFCNILQNFYWKTHITALSVKTRKIQKPIISQRPYLGVLLILMPRFQILHFPGPEMAGLSKKLNSKLGFFKKNLNFIILSFDKFFFLSKTVLKKICQMREWWNLNFFEKSKFQIQFFGLSGHFWTWKMQYLESRHQNE